MMAYAAGGTLGGIQLLSAESVEEALTPHYPELVNGQGLAWYYRSFEDETLVGHDGGDSGVSTQTFFRVSDGVGVVLLANGSSITAYLALDQIMSRLFDEADNQRDMH